MCRLILRTQFLIHQYTDRYRQRLGSHVSGHVKDQGLKADHNRKCGNNTLKGTDHTGYSHSQKQKDNKPRQSFLNTLQSCLLQILLLCQTGQLRVIVTHFIIDRFDHILGGQNTDDLLITV